LYERLHQILTSYSQELNVPKSAILNSLLKDGWGRPLNVDAATNFLSPQDSRWTTLTQSGIVVWSNGPNGTNDSGRGDDILWRIDSSEVQDHPRKGSTTPPK
jgi:hypothetical protein